ncbi:hypothetical protein [Sphingomonas sp.]|uniref:hypothetical protein n=1 Tax=Sphingomonas sp. TaxID=28214 RepID=UPI0025E63449|nr:hypothetical protein [Sphingomonas sp.]
MEVSTSPLSYTPTRAHTPAPKQESPTHNRTPVPASERPPQGARRAVSGWGG